MDTLFVANLSLFIIAMALQLTPRPRESNSRMGASNVEHAQFGWTAYIPYIWVAIVYVLLTQSRDSNFPIPFQVFAWAVGGIIGLVIVRQIITFQENARLSRQLLAELIERKAAEQAVRRLNDELEQRVADRTAALTQEVAERGRLMVELERKNKELESIVYISSHDLRSPLVNIQGFGKNLQKYFGQVLHELAEATTLEDLRTTTQPILAERIPRALGFIETSSTKMSILIDGLLRLSRIGRVPLQREPVDMNLMMQTILTSAAFEIEKNDAQVIVEKNLAGCYGDLHQLNQVFSNLLDNAIKYRAPDRPLIIRIASQVQGDKVVYTVADTGLGMAPENREKIWEIFRRFNENDSIPGEGLGLTIARRIVERHGGKTWVESELGVGSRFFIELPANACSTVKE